MDNTVIGYLMGAALCLLGMMVAIAVLVRLIRQDSEERKHERRVQELLAQIEQLSIECDAYKAPAQLPPTVSIPGGTKYPA